jgi:hypothetical protein
MKKKKYIKLFLLWLALFNWPMVLIWVPFLRLPCFLPALFWINIPALWCGLAKTIGEPHFKIEEFGAMPLTPFSWILITLFWVVLAVIMTVVTAFIQERKKDTSSEN